MSNLINEKLFDEIEDAIAKELNAKTLLGVKHPFNILINRKTEIIKGYNLYMKLIELKEDYKGRIRDIEEVLSE